MYIALKATATPATQTAQELPKKAESILKGCVSRLDAEYTKRILNSHSVRGLFSRTASMKILANAERILRRAISDPAELKVALDALKKIEKDEL